MLNRNCLHTWINNGAHSNTSGLFFFQWGKARGPRARPTFQNKNKTHREEKIGIPGRELPASTIKILPVIYWEESWTKNRTREVTTGSKVPNVCREPFLEPHYSANFFVVSPLSSLIWRVQVILRLPSHCTSQILWPWPVLFIFENQKPIFLVSNFMSVQKWRKKTLW